jgi:hypothetical protein
LDSSGRSPHKSCGRLSASLRSPSREARAGDAPLARPSKTKGKGPSSPDPEVRSQGATHLRIASTACTRRSGRVRNLDNIYSASRSLDAVCASVSVHAAGIRAQSAPAGTRRACSRAICGARDMRGRFITAAAAPARWQRDQRGRFQLLLTLVLPARITSRLLPCASKDGCSIQRDACPSKGP